jgi:hypothetical protein
MVGRFFSYGEMKHVRTTELAEHSASRPTDLQIPKQQLIGRASADPEHAALYNFLASMIDPYIDSFDEEPLRVDVADEVLARVLDSVRYAEDSVSRGSAESRRLTRSRQPN